MPASCDLVAPTIPPGFLKLTARLQQRIDRALGYFGQSRFVFFYFEPRGEEVVWNDGRSYGFATGGWRAFGEKVIPLARNCGAHVGDADGQGNHVLLIDRITGNSYFAPRDAAQRLVAGQ
jgi:hypothetical protein